MKTLIKVSLPVIWISLMAANCNVTQCPCDRVSAKQSVAAGWCTLTIDYCDGTTDEFPVDEVVYASYEVGDCYP